MRSVFCAAFILAAAGCGPTKVAASKDAVKAYAMKEAACAPGSKAEVVYYGLRGENVAANSACFGPTADKLAVVACGETRKAYWGFGDRWEARPGEVTAVEADHVEITLPSEGGSGAVSAVARCGH